MKPAPGASSRPIEARAFEARDEDRVLEILHAAFGAWPRQMAGVTASEFFHWKHFDGPIGPSTLLVAESERRVVGFAGYMPWRFRVGEQTLCAMRGVDLAVDPACRRSGASMAIRAAARFAGEIAFIWSTPNAQSGVGNAKSGRRHVGALPRFLRPHSRLATHLRPGRRQALRSPDVQAETVAELLRDQTRASRLAIEGRSARMRTVKDLGYLAWRYGSVAEYRVVCADGLDQRPGMAIFRNRRHGSFWITHVCEMFVEGNDRRAVGQLLARVAAAAPADFLSAHFPSGREAAMHGFMPCRGRTALMSYPLHDRLDPDPTLRGSWALSLGDLELL